MGFADVKLYNDVELNASQTRSLLLPVLYSSGYENNSLSCATKPQGANALPQRPQNFVPGAYEVPQDLQTTSTERGGRHSSAAEPMGMPHLPQNRMPAG